MSFICSCRNKPGCLTRKAGPAGLEEGVMRDAPPGRRGVWDTRVRDLCSQVLSVAEREIMVRKWKGRIGGPNMDTDFEKWHLVMQNKWRKMSHRRGHTRREEHQGQRTSEQTTGDDGGN